MSPALPAGLAQEGTVLLVDDEPHILNSLRRLLRQGSFRILTAPNARAALATLQQEVVNVIVVDYWMPEGDGLWLARVVRDRFPSVVRIMLTGCIELAVVQAAVQRGEIFRYLVKPWDDDELVKTIDKALDLSREISRSAQRINSQELLAPRLAPGIVNGLKGGKPTAGAGADWKDAMLELAKAVEARDPYTLGHSSRVARLSVWSAEKLGLAENEIHDLELGALLHDIGKVSIPDQILFMPRALPPEDMLAIKQHTVFGENMLRERGAPPSILAMVRSHHEDFDGSGYPDGIPSGRLPVPVRLIRLADAFDAMHHKRPYRDGKALPEIKTEITHCVGRQFDPALTPLFLAMIADKESELG